jgi:Rieske Fe-S protein
MSHSEVDLTPLTPAEVSRRKWLRTVIGGIVGVISSVVGVVVAGTVLSPAFAKQSETWVSAGPLRDLEDGVPTPVTLRVARQDGYAEAVDQQVVFLVKSDAGVRAMSSTCTHLGCHVSYDATTKLLRCPCHGGVFTPEGRVVAGPPPRPLTELPTRIDGAKVFVQI